MLDPRSSASSRLAYTLLGLALLSVIGSCGPDDRGGSQDKDPHVVRDGKGLEPNRNFVSAPTLTYPIYECSSNVAVKNYIPNAKIEVFVAGNLTPVGSAIGVFPEGVNIPVTPAFLKNQVVTAKQTFGGATSGPSNAVTVTSYLEDYPSGMPAPRLRATPIWECGMAIGAEDVVPGATVRVFAEEALAGGGFAPAVQVGSFAGTTEWGLNWTGIDPKFKRDSRVFANQQLCTETTGNSPTETVQPELSPIPKPDPLHVQEPQDQVVVNGPGGALVTGATVKVFADATQIGGTATPGGAGHRMGVSPHVTTGPDYYATQGLCTTSDKSDPVKAIPCAQLPPAKIKPPLPGDTTVTVTQYEAGAQILVYASNQEIGHSGPTVINLSRPLNDGETVKIVQILGDCQSQWIYQIDVACENLGAGDGACSGDWPMFKQSPLRNAMQSQASVLADPYKVKKLAKRWAFPPEDQGAVGGFRAAPIVYKGRVYVGSGDGHLYALDAASGAKLWQFPPADQPALTSTFTCNPSSDGIASSAAIGRVRNELDVVIFGAPDRSIGARRGSGRLFALRLDGTLFWASPEIAVLDDNHHEQIGYSSPLVFGDRVFIGIADHCDNPIQRGRVVAVDLASGSIILGFSFVATNSRGGGVWSSVGGGFENGVFATTGNSNDGQSEPSPNHGLSFLRLNATTGNIEWELHPVPYEEDGDPDWASGMALLKANCGDTVLSTMKDGFTYSVRAAAPLQVSWKFPNVGPFFVGDPYIHGDTRFHRAGAAWSDVFFTTAGGQRVVDAENTSEVIWGYTRLHALNVCGGDGGRVRWISDLPNVSFTPDEPRQTNLSPPSVTGGIVYIGTNQGHLVALADPSVWPAPGSRCTHPDFTTAADCIANGYQMVSRPAVLADVALQGAILNEPALANGAVFVATTGGRVFMLAPDKK